EEVLAEERPHLERARAEREATVRSRDPRDARPVVGLEDARQIVAHRLGAAGELRDALALGRAARGVAREAFERGVEREIARLRLGAERGHVERAARALLRHREDLEELARAPPDVGRELPHGV